jgi:hypothetical protein
MKTKLEREAFEWIRAALSEEVRGANARWLDDVADVLHQITCDLGLRVEACVVWIHQEWDKKEPITPAWAAEAASRAVEQERLGKEAEARLPNGWPE